MFDTRSRGFLNPEEFKLLLAFVFDFRPRSRVAREYIRRVLLKLGKTEKENIPKDLLVNYLVDRGELEKRKVVNALELSDD